MQPYIFNIGFNKSGTVSLCVALNKLEIKTVHFTSKNINFTDEFFNEYWYGGKEYVDLSKYPYQAYSDIYFLEYHFDLFDQWYPNSKFILTLRDKEGWINSTKKHAELSKQHNVNVEWANRVLKDSSLGDRYDSHLEKVTNYFKDKPEKLLIMNIVEGDGYEKLCPFLNVPILNEPFPKNNTHERMIKKLSMRNAV
jgi:hypothetical protein